jgi:hypothetical protein
LQHFAEAEAETDEIVRETRVMVFAQFRDSAEEIVRVLEKHRPMLKPRIFVGQATTKRGVEGMNQKKQQSVLDDFHKGVFNILIATSIGEEGLDIGEVDLIVCYDTSSSPIRMLQRMGRTGRKRTGNIITLLTRGKEERNYAKSKDNYEKMQLLIAAGSSFEYCDDMSPRILPRGTDPAIDQRMVEIPIENSQPNPAPKKTRAKKAPKKPAKKFFMPDGVITGFMKASKLNGDADEPGDDTVPEDRLSDGEGGIAIGVRDEDVLLDNVRQNELEQRYLKITGDEEDSIIRAPRLDAYPGYQRTPRPIGKIPHGKACLDFISMVNTIYDADCSLVSRLRGDSDKSLQESSTLLEDHAISDTPPTSNSDADDAKLAGFIVSDDASLSFDSDVERKAVALKQTARRKSSIKHGLNRAKTVSNSPRRDSTSSLESATALHSRIHKRSETFESDSESDLPDVGYIKKRQEFSNDAATISTGRLFFDSDSEV